MYLWLHKLQQVAKLLHNWKRGGPHNSQLNWTVLFLPFTHSLHGPLGWLWSIPTSTDEDLSPLQPSSWGRWQEYPDGSNLSNGHLASTSQLPRLINSDRTPLNSSQQQIQQEWFTIHYVIQKDFIIWFHNLYPFNSTAWHFTCWYLHKSRLCGTCSSHGLHKHTHLQSAWIEKLNTWITSSCLDWHEMKSFTSAPSSLRSRTTIIVADIVWMVVKLSPHGQWTN